MDKPSILVVDDTESVLNVCVAMLEARNLYSVLSASNSTDALEIVKRGNIDVVLTDLEIPNHPSGVELMNSIRRLSAATRVAIMTGNPGALDEALGQPGQERPDDILIKPLEINLIRVRGAIAGLLNSQKSE